MVKPNFFIVGAPKSGTTALYSYLEQHPDVFLAKKEIYYFCYDLGFRTPCPDERIYMNYFTDAHNKKKIGDASVFYLLSPGAAQQIKNFNPQATIIIMLRNPVQMVYSLHSENLSNGDEDIESFESALNAEKNRKLGEQIPPYHNAPVEALFYSDVAKYYEQVLRYKTVFGADKIHVILFDDFITDTENEYRKVLKFLELEEIMPASFEAKNPSKVVRSKTYLRFLKNPPVFIKIAGRFLFPHYSKRREWLLTILWGFNRKYSPMQPLSNALKQRLVDMYKSDIEKLGALLNKDLSNWLKI